MQHNLSNAPGITLSELDAKTTNIWCNRWRRDSRTIDHAPFSFADLDHRSAAVSNRVMGENRPSGVVRLDDSQLRRWMSELAENESADALRALLEHAQRFLTVVDTCRLDVPIASAENGDFTEQELGRVVRELKPVRSAADELSKAFVALGHIDVPTAPRDPPKPAGSSRKTSSLKGLRRLLSREWRHLNRKLDDPVLQGRPDILVACCRTHLDRIRTLVESIAPTLFDLVAPEGTRSENIELLGACTIRATVVDFHSVIREVRGALRRSSSGHWLAQLHQLAEATDKIIYSDILGWMREKDQLAITEARELLDKYIKDWNPNDAIQMADIVDSLQETSAGLLRINDRPSLIQHDLTILNEVVIVLRTWESLEPGERRQLGLALLVQLDRVRGRDRAIDELTARGFKGSLDWGTLAVRVEKIRNALTKQIN